MTTRTTPFGLFSGVGQGICGKTTDLDIGSYPKHLKRARPDMEWIYKLIQKIEADPAIFNQLKVFLNKTVMIKGNRAKLPFRPKHGAAEADDSAEIFNSIRLTDVVRMTFEAAEHPIRVMELKEILLKAFPDATLEIIADYLQQLVEQEFILSELRPPLMDHSPFHYIFEKIKIWTFPILGFTFYTKLMLCYFNIINARLEKERRSTGNYVTKCWISFL